MKRYFIIFISTLLSLCVQGQSFTYKASRVLMDSTWNSKTEPVVEGIISFFKPEMDKKMNEIIGVSDYEMRSGRPESLLSNFAADAILEYAIENFDGVIDLSLTNFGGLRASLPKGEIKRYDIFSIFPFENYLVVIDLPGGVLRELFESFAKNRVEAFSHNIKLEIVDKTLKEVLINGEQIDPFKTYRMATIDFLMDGGDNLSSLKKATKIDYTGVLLRDAILEIIAKKSREGKKITSSLNKRVTID